MKNILIITVAGTSSRFSKSIGKETLKCIYKEGNHQSILGNLLSFGKDIFDKIIIVGGYKFDELSNYINAMSNPKIVTVYNEHFIYYSSNYSLYMGVVEAIKEKCNIVFAEGDLVVDEKSFLQICHSPYSVVTTNMHLIKAETAVAFYQTENGLIKYIYDTEHKLLSIPEKFSLIANSGQIWKFSNRTVLRQIISEQSIEDYKDTNLNIVQKYFQKLNPVDTRIINFQKWYNCNTVYDYRNAFKTEA